MPEIIIFDLGGVLANLDWDKVCAPLAQLSDQPYDAVLKEVRNGPIVESSMLGHLTPQEFHWALTVGGLTVFDFLPRLSHVRVQAHSETPGLGTRLPV